MDERKLSTCDGLPSIGRVSPIMIVIVLLTLGLLLLLAWVGKLEEL